MLALVMLSFMYFMFFVLDWLTFEEIWNISSIFYFIKLTPMIAHSRRWNTMKIMLFTKYLKKWRCIGKINWIFVYLFNLKSSTELVIEKIDVILVQWTKGPATYSSSALQNKLHYILLNVHFIPSYTWWFADWLGVG